MDPASWPCWLTFCTRTSDICTSSVSLGFLFFFFFYSGKQPKCERLQPPPAESGRVNICGNEKVMAHKSFQEVTLILLFCQFGLCMIETASWLLTEIKIFNFVPISGYLALYSCVSCVHASAVCFQQRVFLWLGEDVAHIYWRIRVPALRCRCEFYAGTWNLSREKDEVSRDLWKYKSNRLVD